MVIPIDLWAEVAVHAFLTLELIYLNSKLLFKPVAPGSRLILGGADTTPPQAISERLVRMGGGGKGRAFAAGGEEGISDNPPVMSRECGQ